MIPAMPRPLRNSRIPSSRRMCIAHAHAVVVPCEHGRKVFQERQSLACAGLTFCYGPTNLGSDLVVLGNGP